MKRLTTDHPEGNFETVLNFVYGKDGVAHLRSDGERDDVPVHEWARKQCIARGCDEFPGETLEEVDEAICACCFDFPDCPVFLAYTFACQAVHLRDRLKMYEDTGLMPAEITAEKPSCVFYCNRKCNLKGDFCAEGPGCPWELAPETAMRLLEIAAPNAPLTLEELREMDGEPVWVKSINDDAPFAPKGWAIVAVLDNGDVSLCFLGEDTYRQTWILSEGSDEDADDEDEIEAVYRRKPGEGEP